MLLAFLLQVAAPSAVDDQAGCRLAEQRLASFTEQFQERLARQIRNRRHMTEFQRRTGLIAAPYLNDLRDSIRDGDPVWVCDRIAQQGIDILTRNAIQPIFGNERPR
jgi:hypothetical protein